MRRLGWGVADASEVWPTNWSENPGSVLIYCHRPARQIYVVGEAHVLLQHPLSSSSALILLKLKVEFRILLKLEVEFHILLKLEVEFYILSKLEVEFRILLKLEVEFHICCDEL